MARRRPRCPDPSAVTRLVPPWAPRILRVKWWLLAPALAALGGVGALLYIRSQYVSFEDLRERHADTQRHTTPWFLWVKRSPDGVVVATQPGGDPPPGTWGRNWAGPSRERPRCPSTALREMPVPCR